MATIMEGKSLLLVSKLIEAMGNGHITEDDINKLLHSKFVKESDDINETVIVEEIVEESPILTEATVSILSLSDEPTLNATVGQENVITVSLCESIPNSCGTARVHFMGTELLMNACDMDGVKKINLDIEINGNVMYNTPFVVKEDSSSENCLQINKVLLCQTNPHSM